VNYQTILSRLFNSTEVVPGTATLFFVNDDGVAITCKHVADELIKNLKIKKKKDKRNSDCIIKMKEGET